MKPGEWIKATPARMAISVVFAALIVVALIPTVITWAPHWMASTKGLNAGERAAEIGRVRTALLAVIAGGIAVVGAIYTARTFALNRQGQVTERFTRAVDQLGSDKLDVRLGGIYALERLARESREDHGPIIEILTAYVREHGSQQRRAEKPAIDVPGDTAAAPTSPDASADETRFDTSRPTTDVQAVLTVLGRRTREYDNAGHPLDLSRAVLVGAALAETHLEGAILAGAHPEGAYLHEAHLENANLDGARLNEAVLSWAHLEGANLYEAHLNEAFIGWAQLEEANLALAHLEGAILANAHLEGANLHKAHLQGANFAGAHLEGAMLAEAHLQGANFAGAHLEEANLDKALLDGANYDPETNWPEGFEPRAAGAVLRR